MTNEATGKFRFSSKVKTGFNSKMEGNIFGVGHHTVITAALDHQLSDDVQLLDAAPDLLAALKELLAACEDDCGAVGSLTEFDGDDEPVGGGLDEDGNHEPMALTFGHLRRAARAIAKAEGSATGTKGGAE